jgi:aldehyde dehydrogenase (NAD+)
MTEYWQGYIGGEWVDGSTGETISIDDPATARPIGRVARAMPADIDRAVEAAAACVAGRSLIDMRPADRGRRLIEMAEWVEARRDEIARRLTLESGKPLTEAGWEVDNCTGFLRYYGGLTDKIEGSYIPLGGGYVDYVVPVPYGVSAHVVPWNYPLELAARGAAPAIAAGNAVVIKSPELDPVAVAYLARAAEAVGMPAGSINVVCGYGHDAGAALVGHPGVSQVTFTGSVETGRKILHAAAERLIPAVVELGGKSPGIVLPDADLDVVTEQTRWGIFANAGQVCSALSRLLVPETLHDELVDRLVDVAASLDVGPGIEDSDMGPIISSAQLDRVRRYVRFGQEDGAHLATGGAQLDREGHFFEPTIFVDVDNDMTIAREEIFGPVLSVIRYRDIDDALHMANDSDYGLVAGVFGNDLELVTHLADRLEAGQVFVNEWFNPSIEAPFGGFKMSGFGREKGQAALSSYYRWKNVAIRTG